MCPASPRLSLSRANRLRQSREFAVLREEGVREARGCLVANWRLMPGRSGSRLGVIASRRIGSAVVRNRAKRLLREVFRRRQHELITPVDLVLVARPSIVGCASAQVEKDLMGLLRRARMLRKL